MASLLKIHFLISVGFQLAFAVYRQLNFERISSTSNLFGLGCAIEQFDKFRSRGARVNPLTRECGSLTESWFKNQIHESGFTYFKLRMKEDVFQPTANASMKIPTVTTTGFSVVLFFNSGFDLFTTKFIRNQLKVMIGSTDQSTIGFQAGIKPQLGHMVFNSFVSGKYSLNFVTCPMNITNPDTVYKFECKFNAEGIQVYLDDGHIGGFPYRTEISNYNVVTTEANQGAEFLQILFYYPS